MSMTDPIADLLTRIRNGQSARKTERAPSLLEAEDGDPQGAEGRRLHRRLHLARDDGKPMLTIELKYYEGRR